MFKDNIFIETSEKLINSSELTEETETPTGIKVSRFVVDSKISKQIDRNKGKYITITYDKETAPNNIEELITIITDSFKNLMEYMKVPKKPKTLFVGLGNKDVTSDSFGYLCIEKIDITSKMFKIYKNTEGITNIKSVDFTRSIADLTECDLIVVFDSLKANHISRLGNTIQLSTGGLYPGSAVTDKKEELSKKTIKKNVISVGIPTVINMMDIEKNNPDLLVSSKDIDKVVDNMSSLLSIVINRLF